MCNDAFFVELMQTVMVTYTVVAADLPFVIAAVQAALHFVRLRLSA